MRIPMPALHISELPLDGVAVSAMASIAPGHSRPIAKQRSIAPCYRSIAKQRSKRKPWCLDALRSPQMGLDGAAIIATWMCCTFCVVEVSIAPGHDKAITKRCNK